MSVVVANHLHREIVEGLLAAGKHVLCEKPLAPSIEDAGAMVAAAGRSSATAAVGFTFRRSPANAAIKQQVERGAIGRLVHFNGQYCCDYGCDPRGPISWRYKGGPGSGALSDIGSHLLDAAEFVCNPIRFIRAAAPSTIVAERPVPLGAVVGHAAAGAVSDKRDPVESEDLVIFTAGFASGATGTFSASRVAFELPNSLGFELFAERGAATFDLARAGEFGFVDDGPDGATSGYCQVLIGPAHPNFAGGMAMDFPGCNYGQNDLFVFQACASLEQIAGLHRLPPSRPSRKACATSVSSRPSCGRRAAGKRPSSDRSRAPPSASGCGTTMQISLATDILGFLPFERMFDTVSRLGFEAVDLGCGNWSKAPHLRLDELLGNETART